MNTAVLVSFIGLSDADSQLCETIMTTQQRTPLRFVRAVSGKGLQPDILLVDWRTPGAALEYAISSARAVDACTVSISADGTQGPAPFRLSGRMLLLGLLPSLMAASAHRLAATAATAKPAKASAPPASAPARPVATAVAARPAPQPVVRELEIRAPLPVASPRVAPAARPSGLPAHAKYLMHRTPTTTVAPRAVARDGLASGLVALVVEPDAQVREQLRTAVEQVGAEVFTIDTASGAEDLLRRKQFDLVLLAVNMAGMDGYQLCRSLKRDALHRGALVMLMTNRLLPLDRARGAFSGCDGYLVRPITAASVRDSLQRVLAGARAGQVGAPVALPGLGQGA